MEATGRDGSWGPSWSYRRHEETGTGSSFYTVSSSRSGTIVSSTAYTSSSSRLSSGISMDAALPLDLELELWLGLGTPNKKDAEFAQPIKKPCKEFFGTPSANRSNEGGNMNVLERWFTELGVSWVLQLDVGASASVQAYEYDMWGYESNMRGWIRALTQIMETIHLTKSFFSDQHGQGFLGMPVISEEEVDSRNQSLDPLQFARFFQKAMSKMLVFVDVLFSKSTVSLVSCLHIHGALSEALSEIRLQFHLSPRAELVFFDEIPAELVEEIETEEIETEMISLLSAKQGKAFEATWSRLEETLNHIPELVDSSGTQTPQGSSDIHDTTYLLMDKIDFLLLNHSIVSPLVSKAASLGKYVPRTGHGEAPPFISLIMEMVSRLQEKLITQSQLFLDKGCMFLFLLNNSNFIRKRLEYYSYYYSKVDVAAITSEVEHCIESYIQVSWASMLSCLSNDTPLCLGRNYSPLTKFESKFQKIYTTQKLWKVPDPELRKRLRKAVIEKIIPAYTKYIEDSKVNNPKFTPQELEEMLQELGLV